MCVLGILFLPNDRAILVPVSHIFLSKFAVATIAHLIQSGGSRFETMCCILTSWSRTQELALRPPPPMIFSMETWMPSSQPTSNGPASTTDRLKPEMMDPCHEKGFLVTSLCSSFQSVIYTALADVASHRCQVNSTLFTFLNAH